MLPLVAMAVLGAGAGAGSSALMGGDPAKGAMIGGLTGGLGGALGGSAMASSTGALGLSKMGMLTGIGGGLMGGAFAGAGQSSGGAPMTSIPLTAAGKRLEKQLHTTIKNDPFPENLVSKHIGKIQKYEEQRMKMADKMMTAASTRGISSGSNVKAMLSDMRSRLSAPVEKEEERAGQKTQWHQNKLINMINFMNTQKQTPVLRAGAALAKQSEAREAGAAKGAALGNIAQMLAMSRFSG